jgi:cellobiose phosphorylase
MLHLMAVHGARIVDISYETDRGRFIGRGNGVADPAAMQGVASLSNTEGSVLDPIVAIRYRITLEAEQSATVNIVTGVAPAREAALGLVEKYQDRRLADRVFELAWTHSQVILRQINASEADAQLYARLAGSVIYANAAMRADAAVLKQNKRGQSGLWGYAISGDLPIVLLEIVDAANIDLVRQMVRAHAWWRLKGLTADLVVWNEDHTGYRQQLNEQIMGLIASGIEANVIDRPGGIFVRPANHISSEDRVLLQSVARAILSDARGPLADQINRRAVPATPSPRLKAARAAREEAVAPAPPRGDLLFDNGLGGFAGDGREYVITTAPGRLTPAPWSNVLANPGFGSVVSESGAAYTWRGNAHEFRLTPWDNDPVTDACGEAYYIRDEDSARFWSPMPLPARGATPYVTRHGFGYSVFEHVEHGIASEAWVYVAREAAVKYTVIRLRNASSRPRRLSLTGYAGWVLGDLRERTMMHVATAIDAGTGAIFATNSYSTEFAGEVAFFDAGETPACITCDRLEFIGRNGRLADPAALHRERLSGRTGHGADPCAAIQIAFDLAPGAQREVVFILGAASGAAQAGALVKLARGGAAARAALDAVRAYWRHTLGAVQVQTPDPMLDLMANGWLLYQTLACRLWARSGYYQSGGAFGFRDQLQDTMALVHAEPALARAHLVLCAGRQFEEGDVQHWWHPPAGRGVRTHCADDFLWLPLATCRYVTVTGDTGVLDEKSPFLTGRALGADADSYYDLPGHDDGEATLYDHCVRAIEHGLRFGAHGLPLIGSGDWNDGMNMVGAQGRGESVWLGFFMYQVLERFGALAGGRGDAGFAARCREQAALLAVRLEAGGWDGAWYRRAYFDDGTPLGSAANAECRIDSVSQSWAVLSGAGEPARARMAMAEVDARLVRREASLVQLLDPPFDKSAVDPGYIKGYVPGVRENGGQYTHAAIWAAMAFAALGDDVRAWEVAAMINPMRHALSPAAVAVYKVEPYVVAADVYAMAPHTGRGGWTWYTGSAGWMYRLLIESLLGLVREGDRLRFMPCLPAGWPGFTLRYRHGGSAYRIAVTRAGSAQPPGLVLDGVAQAGDAITLVDDGGEHEAVLCLPAAPVPAAIAPAAGVPAVAAPAVAVPAVDTSADETPAVPAPEVPAPA